MSETETTTADCKWESQDGAECGRLVQEMRDDARLQFQAFTFALTATAVLLGFLSPPRTGFSTLPQFLVVSPFAYLSPLVILIPASLIVLNRARTRNRKSAYLICFLDRKRLKLSGVSSVTTLDEVMRLPDIPWETGLQLFQRKAPHLAPTLKYMAMCQVATESLCFSLAGVALYRYWSTALGAEIVEPGTIALLTASSSILGLNRPGFSGDSVS